MTGMGGFPENVVRLRQTIQDCTLCPRRCRVDRQAGQRGACRTGAEAVVASFGPHFGEEPPLVGEGGSGTIFLAGCNLDCVFCQNCEISHGGQGRETSPRGMADIALRLEAAGCVNVNFVSPTHVAHAVAETIVLARQDGLKAPVVYNCGGYESLETLQRLEGLIEIYMPDFKCADAEAGLKYSGVPEYPSVAALALEEMFRQVGPLVRDDRGQARRGVLVRHLVLAHDLARSHEVIDIVAHAAPGATMNVMGQYHPAYRAGEFPELLARPDPSELIRLRAYAEQKGLTPAE